MLHEVQMYSQITPMEIDILFQLTDCRHPDGFVTTYFEIAVSLFVCLFAFTQSAPLQNL